MHKPQTINKFQTGLVQSQPNQVLKNDAFPILENALCYRNTARRRMSWQKIGRLQRNLTAADLGNTSSTPWTFNIFGLLNLSATEPNASAIPGTVTITIETMPTVVFIDDGHGNLTSSTMGNSGTIVYTTGAVTLIHTTGAGNDTKITFSYYPNLPVMGIFDEVTSGNILVNVFFDTKYAYQWLGGSQEFQEFLPLSMSTWSLSDWNLPSYTNYWQDTNNFPIFWYTANQGSGGQPIRYTNGRGGSVWYDFTPAIDATNTVWQAQFILPFRGRLFVFNTLEGPTAGGIAAGVQITNQIRCSAPGNPFTTVSGIITSVNTTAWNDTIPGQGYQLPVPTTESITSVSQVQNQIIIKTDTKSWVLTHTGINAAPFKVDLLDASFGASSGFGYVNMGDYITGIGDRAVNNSSPTTVGAIDEKILDLVQNINQGNQGELRVYGIRDYGNRIASFSYPYQPDGEAPVTYPNRRLIYNYDNNSWAIYDDSYTCMGYFRQNQSATWENSNQTWEESNFPWNFGSEANAPPCAGNQQGYVGYIDFTIREGATLYIQNIAYNPPNLAALFTSPNHNLENGFIVQLTGIVGSLSTLNGIVAQVLPVDENTFYLFSYNPVNGAFAIPVVIGNVTYVGGGELTIRRNFNITTKAFNLLEEGQSMHILYMDALVNTYPGASVMLSVYASTNNGEAVNLYPQMDSPALFGNVLSQNNPTTYDISEINNRALVNQRSNLLTFQFSLSNATLAGDLYYTPFVMSSMTLWIRPAGRPLMPFGGG